MGVPDKVLFVHQGALGDFLLAWPALWAVAGWAGAAPVADPPAEGLGAAACFPPKTSVWFVGEKGRSLWTEPLGVRFREPETARAIDRLFGREKWPESLENTLVVWPGLAKRPGVPEHGNLWFLPGIVPGRRVSPRELYLEELQKRGVPVSGDYVRAFRTLFAAGRELGREPGHEPGNEPGRTIVLFPGAGHPRKAWPLVKYLELAVRLGSQGFQPLFVLGPAEVEQGTLVPGAACERPENLAALRTLLLRAAAAIGGDTGPMHLAAMLGVRSLALFGPTDPAVWAPREARILAATADCAPCAGLATDIDCRRGGCLAELEVDAVWAALAEMLGG